MFYFYFNPDLTQPTPERPQHVETATQEQGLETSRLEHLLFLFGILYYVLLLY